MTKPSYEERRITKHSGSPQIADSASSGESSSRATETRPVRIQRKRSKGWKMPPNTVCVSRPSFWGNPYQFGMAVRFADKPTVNTVLTTREGLLRAYREYLNRLLEAQSEGIINELRGKNLACWCPLDKLCHADVLLAVANRVAENLPVEREAKYCADNPNEPLGLFE